MPTWRRNYPPNTSHSAQPLLPPKRDAQGFVPLFNLLLSQTLTPSPWGGGDLSPGDKPCRKRDRVPSISAVSPYPECSGGTEPPTHFLSPARTGQEEALLRLGLGDPPPTPPGSRLRRKRAAPAWSWEVEMRRGGTRLPGSTPELRERLQVKINAFIRPPAPFQPGRYPHTHTEPPPGLVHSGVNPNFSLDKLGSQTVPARR